MKWISVSAVLSVMTLASWSDAAELKSGLDVGDFPDAFYVTDVTGPSAGQTLCYRCQYGSRPVVAVFTRTMSPPVRELIAKIDEVVGQHQDEQMAAFVVLLTDDPQEQAAGLTAFAKERSIRHTPLTTYKSAAGPRKYRIHEDAEVTVIMWVDNDVRVNHSFAAGELTAENSARVVEDTQKILP